MKALKYLEATARDATHVVLIALQVPAYIGIALCYLWLRLLWNVSERVD